ncbi:MAG: FAD-dependent thymidylate synthase [Thermoplasmata archaeon]
MDEFSNRDKDVFLINCARMIDRGALMSRYSRTRELDIRSLWDKEFKGNESRGEAFYERVFLEYGDESVAELVTAQLGVQNVSNVASKIMEEGRIGLSYLEKSSRYVPYREKKGGKYLYLDSELAGIPQKFRSEYEQLSNSLFDLYVEAFDKVTAFLRENFPIEKTVFRLPDGTELPYGSADAPEESMRKAYESAVRSRALDEARFILPSSTLTNLGISGNARGFARMLERLRTSGLRETDSLYGKIIEELRAVFPKLIDSVESPHGVENIRYQALVKRLVPIRVGDGFDVSDQVELVSYEDESSAINRMLAAYLFERTDGEFLGLLKSLLKVPSEDKRKAIEEIASLRRNRRHKLDRSFEHTSYTFQVATNFGAFRDLQRHRIMTLQRKAISTKYGFEIPPIIRKIDDLLTGYKRIMDQADALYRALERNAGMCSQYVVPFAFRYPVIVTLNLRELVYLTELRSTPQAHFDLRSISRKMVEKVTAVHPTLSPLFKFVNMREEELGRLSAELRKELKRSSLG